LDGIVGVEGVESPVITVVVSTTFYLHFISYMSMLTAFSVVSFRRRRLGSSILSWVCSDVWLCTGSISCIVGDVACGVSSSIGWRISHSVGCGVGSRIGYGVDRLCYFIFSSSLFSYWLKGTVATTSLARMFRHALGVRACGQSAVSRASFFDLSGGDADVSLETPYCRSILKLT
jgi:hypothetical protein